MKDKKVKLYEFAMHERVLLIGSMPDRTPQITNGLPHHQQSDYVIIHIYVIHSHNTYLSFSLQPSMSHCIHWIFSYITPNNLRRQRQQHTCLAQHSVRDYYNNLIKWKLKQHA
jgi:hypothetical protein